MQPQQLSKVQWLSAPRFIVRSTGAAFLAGLATLLVAVAPLASAQSAAILPADDIAEFIANHRAL